MADVYVIRRSVFLPRGAKEEKDREEYTRGILNDFGNFGTAGDRGGPDAEESQKSRDVDENERTEAERDRARSRRAHGVFCA